uniref:Formate--tetrahydrofolate ligase n=1 Tax=Eptatretus burgeri TaxID=7764 RepID=A0A8C4Q328_EPTBU
MRAASPIGSCCSLGDHSSLSREGQQGPSSNQLGRSLCSRQSTKLHKFFDIKCRASGLRPSAVVLVATVHALKMHGGGPKVTPGLPLPREYIDENVQLVQRGCCNMRKHISIARLFGLPVVLVLNEFASDSETEVMAVLSAARDAGAVDAVRRRSWAKGGLGGIDLAEAVCQCSVARQQLQLPGLGHLLICMAKTHLSLSHRADLKGAPHDFLLPVRDVRASAGAGFLTLLIGSVRKPSDSTDWVALSTTPNNDFLL